ncbi:RiPP maturation radical SAM C-methyltransferase [Desulfotomaculum sp. 1211_IL3151]|uniref:RiPP maturation radical SAM C-methyltransferase n=1 Tax=Desulfotomaculum sp. 1211_IL3151 TaxID=3084055 RepID=UPI002FDB038D
MPDVCIVSMPYDVLHMPSIGVGQLVSAAKGRGIDAKAVHTKFWFAERIGIKNYNIILHLLNPASLLAEWTFSRAAFPDFHVDDHQYLDLAVASYHEQEFVEIVLNKLSEHKNIFKFLLEIRKEATAFIDEAATRILEMKPRIVGCSSMFQQHCASLALLRKLKELNPEIVTLMGGANCEGIMGQTTLECFPWLDFVMSGEADLNFPDFCEKLLAQGTAVKVTDLPYGMLSRESVQIVKHNDTTCPVASIDDLNLVPVPDYVDYFAELEKYSDKTDIKPALMIETSRGCWWGQRHKCSFCGLNGKNAKYRKKSVDRVVDEITELSQGYATYKFFASDNIMAMSHFKELLPRISETQPPKYTFFFETKANLNEQQVKALRRAGISWIQPGIESLHDNSLRLMNKGNFAAGNVALLKYAMENGIKVAWNYLIGIPGEDDNWNAETAQWLPLIYHLEPPNSVSKIRFDRFSSYYDQPDKYGLKLSPFKTYGYIYPLDSCEIEDMACFFEDYTQAARGAGLGAQRIKACFNEWNRAFYSGWNLDLGGGLLSINKSDNRPQLIMSELEDMTIITDTRDCALQNEYYLAGLEHKVLQFCKQPRLSVKLLENFNRHYGLAVKPQELADVMNRLMEYKLVLKLGGWVLNLATSETIYNKRANRSVPSLAWLQDI